MPQYKLVYIAGFNYSGSTLLDLALGRHPALFSLGEMMYLPAARAEAGRFCTCGQPFATCPVWRAVPPAEGTPEAEYMAPRYGAEQLYPRLESVIRSDDPALDTPELRRHAAANYDVLRRLGRVRDVSAFIDSSKSPQRLMLMHRHLPADFELRVVHLIRDPRSNIQSHFKRGLSYRSAAGAWLRKHQAIRAFLRDTGVPSYGISYERFVTDTLPALNDVLAFLELAPLAAAPEISGRDAHLLEGNEMRFDPQPIRYDDRWKRQITLQGRLIGSALMPFYWYWTHGQHARIDPPVRQAAALA